MCSIKYNLNALFLEHNEQFETYIDYNLVLCTIRHSVFGAQTQRNPIISSTLSKSMSYTQKKAILAEITFEC